MVRNSQLLVGMVKRKNAVSGTNMISTWVEWITVYMPGWGKRSTIPAEGSLLPA